MQPENKELTKFILISFKYKLAMEHKKVSNPLCK